MVDFLASTDAGRSQKAKEKLEKQLSDFATSRRQVLIGVVN